MNPKESKKASYNAPKLTIIISFGVLCNLQKITCIILRNLFGLYLFSHQSCATGTLLLR